MQTQIQLIVGLGNPGKEYEKTRHNAGASFVKKILLAKNISLKKENKFHGLFVQTKLFEKNICFLIPTTYMNLSGQAVCAVSNFYKILPQSILVVHDDLDLPVGTVRLKKGGGHGGHKGLIDIISSLGSKDFLRLRIGIGRPMNKDFVHQYVLSKASKDEEKQINEAMDKAAEVLPLIISSKIEKAMQIIN